MTLLLLVTVIVSGAGAIFVWSTMNDVFRGASTPARALLAVVVLAAVLTLFAWVIRYIGRLEEPE